MATTTTPASHAVIRRPGNGRVAALRLPLNALALWLTVLILPGLHVETDHRVLAYLLLAAAFGLLNAVVKPIVQLVALPFLFSSFGLVLLVVDAAIFALLDVTRLLRADGVLWIVAGGALVGLLSFVFENVLGLTPPLVDEERRR